MQRILFRVVVVVPTAIVVLTMVLREPRIAKPAVKTAVITDVRSDRYETYEPNPDELAQRAQEGRHVVPPKRYEQYVERTQNQTNRHRKLKHKYKRNNNKDTQHVKQSGSTR